MMYMTRQQELERQNKEYRLRLENQKAKQELREAAYQAELAAMKQAMGALPEQVAMLQKTIARYEEILGKKDKEIAALNKENHKLAGMLEKAVQIINKLRVRLHKNSSTSDKPPATDAFQKPKPQSLREKSGKKPGGQKGHTGHTLALLPNPTRIRDRYPGVCNRCGHAVALTEGYTAKQEVDVEVVVQITEERVHEGVCPCCGKVMRGKFSNGFDSPVHYGDNLKAAVALISEHGFVSVAKTAEIINSLTGGAVKLSWGTVVNMQKELSRKLEDTIQTIQAGLIAGKVIGVDETGCRVNGKLNWIQVFCNEEFAFFGLNTKRGDIDDNFGILTYFMGILVHDHLSSYYRYATLSHAECNEHILRALKGLTELFQHDWLREMAELLKTACHAKNELVRAGAKEMPPERVNAFAEQYDAVLAKGWLAYGAATGGSKKKESYHLEERRLLTRLGEFKEEHLLFLKDFNAPFTNNLSEQAIRKFKNKLKIAGCFRSADGASVYARIASLITTLKKQNRNVFEGIRSVYAGKAPISSA
jgi:transposase